LASSQATSFPSIQILSTFSIIEPPKAFAIQSLMNQPK
jgi:hypothetical protein